MISNCISCILVFLCLVKANAENCERLKASLTYTQEKAPRDLSGVLPVVVERVNRVLEGVVDVEVEWTGADLHGRVGEHIVKCKVTRLASVISSEGGKREVYQDADGREVTTQCFHVPFAIRDTNECTLPHGHPMHHQCPEPAVCVNTIGSYECICPRINSVDRPVGNANTTFWEEIAGQERSAWEVSFTSDSKTSCPGKASTHGCCPDRGHTPDGASCRANFHCPTDPCTSRDRNKCAPNAMCRRESSPLKVPDHRCQCPAQLMGNGRACRRGIDPVPEPKVRFDGVTPTEETVKNDFYCGCTKPVVDACAGFPPCEGKHQICTVTAGNIPQCACKPGFLNHETYGCVDETPPLLRLKHDPDGDQTLRLKQGDVYSEHAVDIVDDNAEDYLRSLKIAYSEPLPPGCLTKIGEFHVNYTVATPWTSPPFVRITRKVTIEDVDECKLDVSEVEDVCPPLVPQCDVAAGAVCVNTKGSYSCQCPRFTSGDGFLSSSTFETGNAPEGYRGGTGCRDTSRPVITLMGPNPKVFRTCQCGGLTGIMGGKTTGSGHGVSRDQRSLYETDIKELIRSSGGAELCASHLSPRPQPSQCVRAVDHMYNGDVDLSNRVKVGEPVKKGPLHWAVPYDVTDNAGNEAATVWRDVIVEEVDLADMETRIREEMLAQKDAEVQRALKKALEQERKKMEAELASNARASESAMPKEGACPACPKCTCPSDGTFDESKCDAICKARMQSCTLEDQSELYRLMHWAENAIPPVAPKVVVAVLCLLVGLVIVRRICTLLFNPQAYQQNDYSIIERERMLQESVSYHRSDGSHVHGPQGGGSIFQSPPVQSATTGTHQSVFGSPPPNGGPFLGASGSARTESPYSSIYQHSPIITPSRTGDGVTPRRRTP